ncbi:MAG: SUMF1/EgtB/PvdO family nonheme iron enzyme [Opitutales bacterium]|nr:SUMF1/EgtB/PvdO family nonheme iron enzyme [Opitutales bacterium]
MNRKSSSRSGFLAEISRHWASILIVGVVIALFMGVLYFLTLLGPRAVERQAGDGDLVDVELLAEDVDRLEARFLAALESGDMTAEAREGLGRAIEFQRQIISRYVGPVTPFLETDRLERLLTHRDQYEGALLAARSRELEEQATAIRAADPEEAARLLAEATEMQERLNHAFPRSDQRSTSRLSRLRDESVAMRAQPMQRQVDERVAEARAAFRGGRSEDARRILSEAIEIQFRINHDFRDTRFASLARLQGLERELMDIRATAEADAIDALVRAGEEHMAERNFPAAAEVFTRARELQSDLNNRFRGSRFARSERLEEMEILRQTALSAGLAERIESIEQQIGVDLRARRTASAASAAPIFFREIYNLQATFPRSRYFSEETLLKARYLNLMRDDFASLQDAVYARLVELPDESGIRMLNAEVNQALYARIMGAQPASQRGDNLPVESVSHVEAREFCKRLGWILGFTVRLPTEAEFATALGDLRGVSIEEISWNSLNSDRIVQPVATRPSNRHGFYDLLGNVAEWTSDVSPEDPREMKVVGGSVRDNTVRLNRLPIESMRPVERNRFVGFRFVVEPRT